MRPPLSGRPSRGPRRRSGPRPAARSGASAKGTPMPMRRGAPASTPRQECRSGGPARACAIRAMLRPPGRARTSRRAMGRRRPSCGPSRSTWEIASGCCAPSRSASAVLPVMPRANRSRRARANGSQARIPRTVLRLCARRPPRLLVGGGEKSAVGPTCTIARSFHGRRHGGFESGGRTPLRRRARQTSNFRHGLARVAGASIPAALPIGVLMCKGCTWFAPLIFRSRSLRFCLLHRQYVLF